MALERLSGEQGNHPPVGNFRYWSGDRERAGTSLRLMVMGTTLIWVVALRDIQGASNYVGKADADNYKELWTVLLSCAKW